MNRIRPSRNDREYVFVYGTLRPPQVGTPADDSRYYPQIAAHVQTATPAQLLQGELYDLGAYPAARPGSDIIRGDLLVVEPAAMAIMDRIEGHPDFYQRDKAVVQTETKTVEAWVYWAPAGLVSGRRRIGSGDWLRRKSNQGSTLLQVESLLEQDSEVDDTLRGLVQRFAEADCSWLSTVRSDGQRAHSAPIWHVWYRGRVYLVTLSTAVKTANILAYPGVVITHPDPVNAIIIEGWGTLATGMGPHVQPLFAAKYEWDINSSPEYDTIVEITPTKLLAWGKYGEGRWPGTELLRLWDF